MWQRFVRLLLGYICTVLSMVCVRYMVNLARKISNKYPNDV